MLKILVADSISEFCKAVAETFDGRYTVFACSDGKTALDLICTENPDVLWLDLTLPNMDGMTILQAVNRAGFHPKVIASARHFNDYVLEALSNIGVSFLVRKPVALPAALSRIEDLAQSVCAERNGMTVTAESLIYDALLLLGLTGKHTGHKCLEAAIRFKAYDPSLMVTKTLYPAVVALCGGSVQSVERAIRREISAAWEKRESAFWKLYFPDYTDRCPSNGVLIENIARCIRSQLQPEDECKQA